MECHFQLVGNAIDILLQKFDAVFPGSAVNLPMLVIDLVDADQYALLVLAHVGESLQVHGHGDLEIQRRHLGYGLGDKIVMAQGRERQVQADHASDLLGPEAAGIHHVLGMDGAFLGDQVPAVVPALLEFQHPVVLDDRGAAFFRRSGIGVNRAGCVDVPFPVRPQSADDPVHVHDGTLLLDLCRGHQVAVLDADGLEHAVGRLQPFPAFRCGSHGNAAGHMKADGLARLLFDFGKKIDGIGLQGSHVGVGIERMDAPGCVPGGTGGEYRAFDQADIGPAEFRQVVEDGCADDATANDGNTVVLHGGSPGSRSNAGMLSPGNFTGNSENAR